MTMKKSSHLVQIPRAEYEAFLAERDQLKLIRFALGITQNPGSGRTSKIDGDSELADFILRRFQTHKLADIAQLCLDKFGPERAPSKSAIHRYQSRLNGSKRVVKRTLKPL
jgi:hypothetical protein